ncbi:MAG TPA: serine hydrolase domain-containing protein [Pyrinomonadaceae bacterium]|nr:serine hydrolase domain-containing protein [Pyrinomonadaceae bacterium]
MRRTKTLLLASILLIQPASAGIQGHAAEPTATMRVAAGATDQKDKDLARIGQAVQAKLTELYKAAEFPGATVGFVLPNGRYGSVAVGVSDLATKTPLNPRDRMLAGSIGKTYVAAVVLQLVEEGKINLDDKIERWLGHEAWFTKLPNAKEITLRMLMNHTSGIPEHVLKPEFITAMKAEPDKVWKPEEMISFIFDAKPLFAAGKGFSYADTNYILVGMIFERVTKKNLYDEVSRRVLKPLRLVNTIPSDRRILPGVVTGHSRPQSPFGFEGPIIVNGKFLFNPQMEWTGGGFASTAEELARWAKALYEAKAFGKPYRDQMVAGDELREALGSGYGLAAQVWKTDLGVSYGHGGWFPGYLSQMEYFPDQKIAVAIQFNTDAVRQLKKGPRRYLQDIARVILAETAAKKAA